MDANRPLQIVSTDIDQSKYTHDSAVAMRTMFPDQDDQTIARFLIARNGNVEKASVLLKEDVEWRAANLPVYKQSCLNEIAKGKLYLHGTDKEGHPLLIWRVRFNFPKERDVDEMGRMVLWWLNQAVERMTPDKSKVTVLMDRSGFTQENSDMEFMRHMSPIMQNHFPERMHRVVVYPSGFVFYGLWNIAKWFLDPVTQQKVKPVLLLAGVQEYIEDEFIPVEMGGTCTYQFNHEDYSDPVSKVDGSSTASAETAAASPVSA